MHTVEKRAGYTIHCHNNTIEKLTDLQDIKVHLSLAVYRTDCRITKFSLLHRTSLAIQMQLHKPTIHEMKKELISLAMFNSVVIHYRCKYTGGVHEVQNLQNLAFLKRSKRI